MRISRAVASMSASDSRPLPRRSVKTLSGGRRGCRTRTSSLVGRERGPDRPGTDPGCGRLPSRTPVPVGHPGDRRGEFVSPSVPCAPHSGFRGRRVLAEGPRHGSLTPLQLIVRERKGRLRLQTAGRLRRVSGSCDPRPARGPSSPERALSGAPAAIRLFRGGSPSSPHDPTLAVARRSSAGPEGRASSVPLRPARRRAPRCRAATVVDDAENAVEIAADPAPGAVVLLDDVHDLDELDARRAAPGPGAARRPGWSGRPDRPLSGQGGAGRAPARGPGRRRDRRARPARPPPGSPTVPRCCSAATPIRRWSATCSSRPGGMPQARRPAAHGPARRRAGPCRGSPRLRPRRSASSGTSRPSRRPIGVPGAVLRQIRADVDAHPVDLRRLVLSRALGAPVDPAVLAPVLDMPADAAARAGGPRARRRARCSTTGRSPRWSGSPCWAGVAWRTAPPCTAGSPPCASKPAATSPTSRSSQTAHRPARQGRSPPCWNGRPTTPSSVARPGADEAGRRRRRGGDAGAGGSWPTRRAEAALLSGDLDAAMAAVRPRSRCATRPGSRSRTPRPRGQGRGGRGVAHRGTARPQRRAPPVAGRSARCRARRRRPCRH